MVNNKSYKKYYGVNYRQWLALRAKIMFKQRWKCYGCGCDIGVKKGDKHLHHLDGNPKHTFEANLVVVCELDHWFFHDFQLKTYKAKPKPLVKLEVFL